MTPFQVEIQVIMALVAAACALPGVFLVLRRMALMSDAISHSVLFGIVIAFFIVREASSPLLILGAAASGVLTVWLVETLLRTGRVKEDAAMGLVFPLLFSIGVILIALYAENVHLDIDTVLLGEVALAPLNRFTLLGINLPLGVWMMSGILFINLALLLLFYKELKLSTFDTELAAALGFSPALLHYALMTVVSVTTVGAFDHVGPVLVVALMIAPPAAAYLLTETLWKMLALSVAIGVVAAISGYWLANTLDTNIAGAAATMTGVFFLLALLFAPQRGLLAKALQRRRRRQRFAVEMLLVHLHSHEGTAGEATENCLAHLTGELKWQPAFAQAAVKWAQQQGLIAEQTQPLALTDSGRTAAQQVLNR
ncbi:MAG: metal ABC transporter permease [Chloroflexi bacterium]|nr:metal ABC transporter permease [Chloroflexota bacterium]